MKLGHANITLIDFDPYTNVTNASTVTGFNNHELGAHLDITDGRSFRFAKAGASALGVGKLATAPTPKANHHNMAVQAAAAIGATTISVTLGATAAVAQEYAEGFLTISVTPGQGQIFKISDQQAASSSATQTVTVYDPVNVALTTSSKANLVHNSYNMAINGTSQTTRTVGVPLVPVTASTSAIIGQSYFWAQCKGTVAVLADQTIALGSRLAPSGSVAGSVIAESSTFATAQVTTPIGVANIMAGVDTEYRPMFLNVD